MVIGTTSVDRRKEFGLKLTLVSIVTFVCALFGLGLISREMRPLRAGAVAFIVGFIYALGEAVITRLSHFSYFRGLGYSYPRILWEYFFERKGKPFGDKKNHSGKVEPLQF
jgi:hypothetical protein